MRDELQELAIATTGERIIFLSSLGSTETAPLNRVNLDDLVGEITLATSDYTGHYTSPTDETEDPAAA